MKFFFFISALSLDEEKMLRTIKTIKTLVKDWKIIPLLYQDRQCSQTFYRRFSHTVEHHLLNIADCPGNPEMLRNHDYHLPSFYISVTTRLPGSRCSSSVIQNVQELVTIILVSYSEASFKGCISSVYFVKM
jgi:hypothetical protein